MNDTVRRTDTLEEVDMNKLFPSEDPDYIVATHKQISQVMTSVLIQHRTNLFLLGLVVILSKKMAQYYFDVVTQMMTTRVGV